MPDDDARVRRQANALALSIWIFYLLLTPLTTLWDRDEPRFARASVEMYESGQYLYPTVGGELRAAKPILIYWLMTLSIRVFGATELAVRFWAPLGIAAAAYATFVIGRRLISARAGLTALHIVALNPLAFVQGAAATTDAVLLAFVTVAIAAIAWRWTSESRLGPAALFTAGVAGGLLTKGPVGLLPVLVASGALVAWRRRPEARRVAGELSAAAAIALGLFALWAIPANTATAGRFLREGVGHDIVARVLTPLEGHGGNLLLWLPFYPMVIIAGFVPWSAYLPAALHLWRRDDRYRDVGALLVWWIAGPVILFSLAATRLPHYVLPAWPALALAAAAAIESVQGAHAEPQTRRWVERGTWVGVMVCVTACLAILVGVAFLGVPGLIVRSLPGVVIVLTAAAMSVRAVRAADFERAFRVSLAGTALCLAWVGWVWLPGVESVKPVPRLVAALRAAGRTTTPTATYSFAEPTLDFYLREVPERLHAPADVVRWAASRAPGVLITTRDALVGLEPLRLEEVATASGLNVANGRAVELVALARAGGR